jgi:sugar lactone lactonase YvrE
VTIEEGWRLLWDAGAVLGEGAVWHARQGRLWWVDIKGPGVHWLDPASGERGSWTPPIRIGSLAPRVGGGFVAGTEDGLAFVDPAAKTIEPILDPEPERTENRFNDGALDLRGRFWAGSMDDGETQATGALYRLDASLDWRRFDDGYHVTNGPAFSPDDQRMYHNDSGRQITFVFDLDADGEPGDRRVFAEHDDGYPDGMTCDAEGCLWIAFWDGWEVRRFAPDGTLMSRHRLPVARPTRPAFGGEGLDRLFVTSASIGVDKREQPLAGGLFEICDPGAKGVASPEFAA